AVAVHGHVGVVDLLHEQPAVAPLHVAVAGDLNGERSVGPRRGDARLGHAVERVARALRNAAVAVGLRAALRALAGAVAGRRAVGRLAWRPDPRRVHTDGILATRVLGARVAVVAPGVVLAEPFDVFEPV